MPSLSKKQLKDIKKQFRENTINDVDTSSKQPLSKASTRSFKKQVNQQLKKTVNITWNIAINDLVYVKDPNTKKEVIGLVIKEDTDRNQHVTDASLARDSISRYGRVLVMTGSGRFWYQPSKLEKIYDD